MTTTAPSTQSTQSQATTTAAWATEVIDYLNAIGGYNIQPTPQNIANIQTWIAAEGGSGTNPLNTSYNNFGSIGLPANNATKFSSAGFPEYATTDVGAQATALTLIDGKTKYNYGAIIGALQQSASLPVFTQAVANSSWDKNHYAGTGFLAGTDQPNTGSLTGGAGDTGQANPESDLPNIPGLSTIASVETYLAKILLDFTSTSWWDRVGLFVLGGVVFTIGLVVFIESTDTGRKITKDVGETAAVAAVA